MQHQIKRDDGAIIRFDLNAGTSRVPSARVVLIHALGLDRTNWSDVIARLPETVAVASVDVRGHGLSTNGTSPLTLETAAADIAHVIREAGWQSAIVVGCSMGGCIAQAVAAYHREIVEGLVLIDTTAWYGPDAPATWAGRAVKAESEGFAALLPFQRERWFSPAFLEERPDVLQHCVDVFLKNDIVTYKAACAMLGQADLRAHLPKIGVPTAVVVGEEDYATPPAMAEAMRAAIPGATLNVLSGMRHFTPFQAPEAIAAEILGVVERVASGAGKAGS